MKDDNDQRTDGNGLHGAEVPSSPADDEPKRPRPTPRRGAIPGPDPEFRGAPEYQPQHDDGDDTYTEPNR